LSVTQEIATKQVLSIMSETAKDHPRILDGCLNLRIFALSVAATFAIEIEESSEKLSLKELTFIFF
jgi:hypothetical protein